MIAPRTRSWFLAMMALAALGLIMSMSGAARPLQSSAQRLAAPLESGVSTVTNPVADFFANVGSYGKTRQENVELRQENERLRSALAQVAENDSRAADLADLLGLANQYPRDQLVFASVIAREPGTTREMIAINRGRDNGIEAGMSVLSKGGALIGTIDVVHETVSWIRLVNDRRSAVNVVVQESRSKALAGGTGDATLRLDFLSQGADLKVGDSVVTSGLGGRYPAGLLVGRVASVDGGPHDIFKRAQVEPAARLSGIDSVAVLTGYIPTPIESAGR